jgi:hypothetical protein
MAIEMGVNAASAPPAIITSASPYSINLPASPINRWYHQHDDEKKRERAATERKEKRKKGK